GTIHSLCATILRANAAYVGIDPQFEVLDEVDAEIMRDDAIDLALSEMVDAAGTFELEGLFASYDIGTIKGTLQERIALPADVVEAMMLDAEPRLDEWIAAFNQHLNQALAGLQRDRDFQQALNWRPANGWPAASDKLMQMWQIVFDNRTYLLANEVSGEAFGEVMAALKACRDGIKLTGGTAAAWGGKAVQEEAKAQLGLIRDTARAILAEIGDGLDSSVDSIDLRAALVLPAWGRAIAHSQEVY